MLAPQDRGAVARYRPYAFTEQGVAMLSSVLRSPRAVKVNIEIMRAFVRLRQMLQSNAELAKKLDALEMKYNGMLDADPAACGESPTAFDVQRRVSRIP